ncbi:hypothetical protein KI387_002189, partial [Taxus chinensis]
HKERFKSISTTSTNCCKIRLKKGWLLPSGLIFLYLGITIFLRDNEQHLNPSE